MRFFPLEPSEPALILRLIPALLIIRVEPRLELRNSKKKIGVCFLTLLKLKTSM